MTFLIRMLEEPQSWAKYQQSSSDSISIEAAPSWAVREFSPRKYDKDGLSLFEVESESDAEIIAGAFAYNREKIESGLIAFAVATRRDIEACGLEVCATAGKLNHMYADARHREVMIRNLRDVRHVLECFMNGDFFSFEGKIAAAAARKSARDNGFDFLAAASGSLDKNWKAKNIMKFISEKIVIIQGVPLTNTAPSPTVALPLPEHNASGE